MTQMFDTAALGFAIIFAILLFAYFCAAAACKVWDFFYEHGWRSALKQILLVPVVILLILGIPSSFFYGVGWAAQKTGIVTLP